ncbi:protein arginine kinase [Tissierella creatinophila]|uniref:Protein-arginine kinase n=1 Tax=Tissierella creatinophila DSM 6911 TaxID=1123403 RepID=A0A1U7M4G6_TISCR|nr:protein arginine kinase [Tissierella creatinophila]OLS02175.1 putative ATP:guanido phosphotransferase [Tissierella creatinophila DSM 6911]
MTQWLDEIGEEEDIVISTRVRVARNLSKYKFPEYMSISESDNLTDDVLNRVKKEESDEYKFKRLRDLNKLEQRVYVEDHLISPSILKNENIGSFLLRKDEKATIMINEEDHLRIQTLFPGLNLEKAWELCSSIDDFLEEELKYAYDSDLGYLTACPTNVGTGLRASVMLHLPCVSMTGSISVIIEGLRKIGLTARGLYGEGSEALGFLYQISNQITLGDTEEEIINKLDKVVHQILTRERNTRKYLTSNRLVEMENKVYRSLGILKYSRILSSTEAMEHLSNIRMGETMNILKNKELSSAIKLMIDIQPANIQKKLNKEMNSKERDIERARMMREFTLGVEV